MEQKSEYQEQLEAEQKDPKGEYRKEWERQNPPRLYPRLGSVIEVITPHPTKTDVIGRIEVDERGRIAYFRADGVMISLTDDTPFDTIFAEILRCAAGQDKKHGGPEHDDTHNRADWCGFIQKFRNRAELAAMRRKRTDGVIEAYRDGVTNYEANMIHIATLAIRAIQSSRRKAAKQGG